MFDRHVFPWALTCGIPNSQIVRISAWKDFAKDGKGCPVKRLRRSKSAQPDTPFPANAAAGPVTRNGSEWNHAMPRQTTDMTSCCKMIVKFHLNLLRDHENPKHDFMKSSNCARKSRSSLTIQVWGLHQECYFWVLVQFDLDVGMVALLSSWSPGIRHAGAATFPGCREKTLARQSTWLQPSDFRILIWLFNLSSLKLNCWGTSTWNSVLNFPTSKLCSPADSATSGWISEAQKKTIILLICKICETRMLKTQRQQL